MPNETLKLGHIPRQQVTDCLRLLENDTAVCREAQEEASGSVASADLRKCLRALAARIAPAWEGLGSVVRQEGKVKMFSRLLHDWRPQLAELDYISVSLLEPKPRRQGGQRILSEDWSSGIPFPLWALQASLGNVKDPEASIFCRDVAPLAQPASTAMVLTGTGGSSPYSISVRCGSLLADPTDLSDLYRVKGFGVLLPNVAEVSSYLSDHQQLSQLLPNICAEVRKAFGPQVELSLELYKDPEIDDRYLTLYVRKEKYAPDILDRLEAVSECFNRQLEEVPGYFLLATDFAPPREKHVV